MTLLPRLPRSRDLDLSFLTWRGRAVRYVLIYLALALGLNGLRYATSSIRPQLIEARDREAALIKEKDDLQVRIQALQNPQVIPQWASNNGMRLYAESPKEILDVPAPDPPVSPAPPEPVSQRAVEVRTEWK